MTAPHGIDAVAAELAELLGQTTPGKWRRIAHGGDSTVVSPGKPSRNDTRIPSYAYLAGAHCIAYPFLGEEASDIRLDFVSFAHGDAAFIAAAHNHMPTLLEALRSRALRIEELEKALRLIRAATDAGDADSYRADDREGCLDYVSGVSSAALREDGK